MNMTAVAIVAIVCWATVKLIDTVFKKRNSTIEHGNNSELAKTIEELRDRIATLEKIVTDEKYNLNREFENLKND